MICERYETEREVLIITRTKYTPECVYRIVWLRIWMYQHPAFPKGSGGLKITAVINSMLMPKFNQLTFDGSTCAGSERGASRGAQPAPIEGEMNVGTMLMREGLDEITVV